jgi:hypothetical protein
MSEDAERDPHHHTRHMQQRLQELIDHLRSDISKVDEPRAKAMFETSAEVLSGLKKAFSDYDRGSENAWRLRTGGGAAKRVRTIS